MNKFVCGAIVVLFVGLVSAQNRLQERYNWRQLDWVFPNQQVRDRLIATGDYIPTNGLPVGIERWQNKLFVTVPRWRNGIPAALNYIDMNQTPAGSPPLIPYPSFENNVAGDCANGLSTVYRIKADKCGRLWVLDTGTVGIGNTTQNLCPYALNVFDLATDRRIRRYEFRPEDTNPNTFIANIAVDIGRNCEDAFAYFSDELGYGLVAYSWEQNRSWRFDHSFFFPDPLRGDFNIAGLNFQWGEEGIFGMALSPLQADGFRTLYFSPLASNREFSVSTRILRDETRAEESYHDFSYFPEERAGNGHTTARVMSENGVMLFNLIDQNAVGCWNSATNYAPQNHDVVDRDDEALVFPADVKIDETNTVWVISDRMPVFLIAQLDYTDINFRIFSAPLDALVAGTVCSNRRSSVHRFAPPANSIYPINYGFTSNTLSRGYDYTPTPSPHIFQATQSIATSQTPKAYIFNQHNGVTLKTESPNNYYTPSSSSSFTSVYPTPNNYYNQPNSSYQQKKNNNRWSQQYYY